MAAEQKPEHEKGPFEEIRREVIESRNLVIKADNQLKTIHAELKMIGKRQEDGQRRQWLATGVAYALFVVLCVGASIGITAARSSSASSERERLEKELGEARGQVETRKAEQGTAEKAQRAAADLLRKLASPNAEERLEAAEGVAKLDSAKLSPLERQALADRADGVRREAGAAALERGKTAFRRQEYANAAKDLGRALAFNPADADALETSFMLGSALVQLRKPEEAIPLLHRAVVEDKRAKTRDLAMLLLAQAYEQTSQFDKAAEVCREALGSYPNSEFTAQLKARLTSAKRGMGVAVDAPAPAPAAAPPAPAPEPIRQPLRPPPPAAAPGGAAKPPAPPAAAPAAVAKPPAAAAPAAAVKPPAAAAPGAAAKPPAAAPAKPPGQ
jgi:tetratricopeptide (TPR) repeat protein